MSRVRVLVWHRATAEEMPSLVDAYHQVSHSLTGTAGLICNELLHAPLDPSCVAVMSEWESLDAFRVWENGASHRGTTTPLRRFQDRDRARPFDVLSVTARYEEAR